jgi:dTDP-4-amino-4,6-dideoxygalactose transaminase
MQVPLLDLHAQWESIRDDVSQAVQGVLESQKFINGPEVKQLEAAVADYCDCPAAVGVSSGTDALIVSLMSLGIGEDKPACRTGGTCDGAVEVITTPYTFFATAGAIWRVGARPVFVDIRPDTFNIDTTQIEAAITDRTAAIMPVHLFGQVAEMDPIMDIAARHNLAVIEDGAQAIGASYKGKKAGSFGNAGCFSFFPSKNLGGIGDGGMVTATDTAFAEKLAQCRNHGSKPKYYHKWVGGNFRLDTIQAAALLVKLQHLDAWSAARRENAAFYDKQFADIESASSADTNPLSPPKQQKPRSSGPRWASTSAMAASRPPSRNGSLPKMPPMPHTPAQPSPRRHRRPRPRHTAADGVRQPPGASPSAGARKAGRRRG